MDDFQKANQYLTGGAFYGIGAALTYFLISALIMLFVFGERSAIDPLTALFIGLILLFILCIGIIIALLGIVSIIGVVFGFVAINKQKRKHYKMCLIFSKISLNPVSVKGAAIGVRAATAKLAQ